MGYIIASLALLAGASCYRDGYEFSGACLMLVAAAFIIEEVIERDKKYDHQKKNKDDDSGASEDQTVE